MARTSEKVDPQQLPLLEKQGRRSGAGHRPVRVEVACWAHARRNFFERPGSDPLRRPDGLAYIGQLYSIECTLRRAGPERVRSCPMERRRRSHTSVQTIATRAPAVSSLDRCRSAPLACLKSRCAGDRVRAGNQGRP